VDWNFKHIEYFLKAAETLNFSLAAKELFISTQALNRHILDLEEQLNGKLFIRTTRKMELSELGKSLFNEFMPVKLAYDAAVFNVNAHLGLADDTVRISFFDALPKSAVIDPVINYLKFRNPALNIVLESIGLDSIYPRLVANEADMCITNKHPFEMWEDVEFFSLGTFPAKIVVSYIHPWMVREAVTAEDMAQMPVLLLRRRKLSKDNFYRKLPAKERVYVQDFTSMLANLNMGECFAVFPKVFEGANWLNLRYLDLPAEMAFNYELACVYKHDSRFKPLFSSMQQFFEETPIELIT